MHRKYHYQLVRDYGEYDFEYTIHEATITEDNEVRIAAIPFTLVGNHPEEILDTLKQIAKDMKKHKPVDRQDCDIYHDELWHDNEYFDED